MNICFIILHRSFTQFYQNRKKLKLHWISLVRTSTHINQYLAFKLFVEINNCRKMDENETAKLENQNDRNKCAKWTLSLLL